MTFFGEVRNEAPPRSLMAGKAFCRRLAGSSVRLWPMETRVRIGYCRRSHARQDRSSWPRCAIRESKTSRSTFEGSSSSWGSRRSAYLPDVCWPQFGAMNFLEVADGWKYLYADAQANHD